MGFGPVVLVMGATSTFAGLSFIGHTVMKEAKLRVEMDLNGAWSAYGEEMNRLQVVVGISAQREAMQSATRTGRVGGSIASEFETFRRKYDLDYLTVTDENGVVLLRSRYPHAKGDTLRDDPVIEKALGGAASSGTLLLSPERLRKEGDNLDERAFIPLVYTERAIPTDRAVEPRGMALEAAMPILNDRGDVTGTVYGGVLLNRKFDLVDRIRRNVFGDKSFGDRPVGTVTLFLGDVRIATNVTLDTGARALGTRVSEAVATRVLDRGERFADRAFVVNDWYLSAYDPIRDPRGEVIGIIYVGLLEKTYSGYKSTLVRQYLGISLLALLVCVAVTLTLSSDFRRPILRLVKATREISAGNLNARVTPVRSSREIHELGKAFNLMAEALESDRAKMNVTSIVLQRAYAAAEERNKAYMEMLGFVTHELKSPLASIVFAIHGLRDRILGPLTPEQEALLKSASTSADYLQATIFNYLNLTRIEEGGVRLRLSRVAALDEVIRPVLEGLSELSADRGMRIESAIPAEAGGVWDRDLVRAVFQNLLSNAIKYGREGGRIRLSWRRDEESRLQRFSVWNEGCGFDPDSARRLFQKFSRLHAGGEDTKSGTGLGLFVSARIVEKHGGAISARSDPGQWAEFVVSLPDAAPGLEEAGAGEPSASG